MYLKNPKLNKPASKLLFIFIISSLLLIFVSKSAMAHCPLCVIGAGAAAAGAVWLGVSKVVVALFIGAFAMSMGMWFSKLIKKKYIPFQKTLIVAIIFLTTLIPLMPIFKAIGPLYLSFIGDYGATYAVNYSLVSGLFGGVIVFFSPLISKKITKIRRGKTIPYQGVALTLLLLILVGILVQFGLQNSGAVMSKGSVELLSPEEFDKIIIEENVFLLNVHTPYEGEIEGTDLIIEDWENIEKYMDKLPKDTSVPIAVYCRNGRMSGIAAEKLKEMGYKVYDLDGGMNAWKESGRKIV